MTWDIHSVANTPQVIKTLLVWGQQLLPNNKVLKKENGFKSCEDEV
jgi:hypothetical protein